MNETCSRLLRCGVRFFFMLTLISAVSHGTQQKPIVLNHADSLVGLIIDGEQARQLLGNVHFTQGSVEVRCKRAIQYLKSNRIALEGDAEVWDGKMRMVATRGIYDGETKVAEGFDRVMLEESTTTLKAKYGKYFSEEKRAFFTTDVVVEDTASVLTADELTYFRDEQHSIAVGHVKITSHRNHLTIFGERFESFKKKNFSRMTGHPKFFQIDTTGENKHDTLTVTCKIMESHKDSIEQLITRDSVVITRGALAAEAGLSVFYTELDSMVLRKSPFVWYGTAPGEDNQLSGDSIFIKLQKRKLQTVVVRGSAFTISNADTMYPARFNQMSGEEIVFRFDSSKIKQIDVDKTATNLYYLFEDGKGNGVNKTSGDHVTITFHEGKIDKLKVTSGVEGQFFPEKMIRNRESDYNLQGFNWREHRPGKKILTVENK